MIRRKPVLWAAVSVLIVAAFFMAVCWGSRTVTVLSENMPIERTRCYIIDPGHGGIDGGATSCSGKLESAFNLEIGTRLNDLMHLLGCDTRMIRTEDISIYTKGETIAQKKVSDLKERVRICNETGGALLLSIHQNTFSNSRYKGAQVFYGNGEESRLLAEKLQTQLIRCLNPDSNRKAKRASGIYLMEHIQCPGILIECGFLSNHEEEAKLRDPEYQKKLCCIIASEVITFPYPNT